MTKFDHEVFADRRKRFFSKLQDGIAVLIGGKTVYRNEDVAYPFRQNSDFYYLTGFEEPESYAFFIKDGDSSKFILLVPKKDEKAEVWTGFRAGSIGAKEVYKADEAFETTSQNTFKEKLAEYTADKPLIYFPLGFDEKEDKVFIEMKKAMYWRGRRGGKFPEAIMCPRRLIHELRMIKNDKDIKIMEKAAEITKKGFIRAMKESRPGMFEYQVQAILDHEYRRLGSERDGYEHIVAAGANACVLHYVTNRDKIEENELILIDSGAEFGHYSADVTRTFPAGKKFTEPQKKIYNLVLKSQVEAIKMSKPGANLEEIHKRVCIVIREGLKELGFFRFNGDEEIEKEQLERRYFMHGTSHWLGMDVHDVGFIKVKGDPVELKKGMMFTIEPGLYFDPRDTRVPEEFRGIGVRIEDDILITDEGNRNLTYSIPKTIEEIESLLAE